MRTAVPALRGISIHALVKRATRTPASSIWTKFYFNPRPRKEGDLGTELSFYDFVHFNPRPRKEGDSELRGTHSVSRDFNPRPRKEGDGR